MWAARELQRSFAHVPLIERVSRSSRGYELGCHDFSSSLRGPECLVVSYNFGRDDSHSKC